MFIAITRSGLIELHDAANFSSFKIVDWSGKGPLELAVALDGLASLTPDGTAAWVDAAAVPKLLAIAPTEQWHTSFCNMVTSARKLGWLREATGAVRAHIERAQVA
jgi:hypothetical protein